MSSVHNHALVNRDHSISVVSPLIPLNFVYPGLSLAQIVSIIRAYRMLSLLILLVVLSITGLIMTVWPRTYTAMVTLMVNYEVNDPLNGKELPVGQVGSYIATQVELMQTPEVLLAVVDRLKLTENKDYAQGYRGDSGNLSEWVAKKISKNLVIYQGQMGSQLIYVTYSANNPTESAQVANMVAEVYKEQDHTRSSGPPGERTKRYAAQLDKLKAKVDLAQKRVTEFHQRNSLIDEGSKSNVDIALLATLEGRLLEAQNARRAAGARASGNQSSNDQVLASTFVQSLKSQLATQEARLAQLTTAYAPQHPDIIELESQITATRNSLNLALQSYTDNAATGLRVAKQLEQSLQQEVVEHRNKVLSKGRLHDEAAKYLLEFDSAQAVYKRALDNYDQISFAAASRLTNVSFVSHATPPVKPSKPKVLTGIMLGVIAAFILAFGIPLIYELFNRRVRCRDDLERHHGIPVLVEFSAFTMRTPA
jgi:polysaccharide biosynthesis transport protein